MLETLFIATLIFLFLNRTKKKRRPRSLDSELKELIQTDQENKGIALEIKNYLLSIIESNNNDEEKFNGAQLTKAQEIIDRAGPGFIYLMTHQHLQSHKVGIGGSMRSRSRDRVTEHQKFGWSLHSRKDFETADDAFQVEQKVLIWLRQEMKLGVFLSASEMPQGGYSETVDAAEINLTTIWAKVEELSKVKR